MASPYKSLRDADTPLAKLATPNAKHARRPSLASGGLLSPAVQMQLRKTSAWGSSPSPPDASITRFGHR